MLMVKNVIGTSTRSADSNSQSCRSKAGWRGGAGRGGVRPDSDSGNQRRSAGQRCPCTYSVHGVRRAWRRRRWAKANSHESRRWLALASAAGLGLGHSSPRPGRARACHRWRPLSSAVITHHRSRRDLEAARLLDWRGGAAPVSECRLRTLQWTHWTPGAPTATKKGGTGIRTHGPRDPAGRDEMQPR